LHLLNGLTFVYGQFARVMLGMSDTAWRLEEAQATAAQQRARAEQAGPQHLALIIEDDGIGMSANELEHIFERFYRSDASRTRTTGGFGLGLAIVHDLVTAMGGSIAVESTEGRGSRFTVLLCVAT